MNKKKWIAILTVLLLSMAGIWAYAFSGDPQLAKVRAMGEQMRAEGVTDEQRREMWGQMREEVGKLSEDSRQVLFAEQRQRWEARERERMREFFALTPKEQIAKIDKDIDEWERRRKARAKNNGKKGDRGDRGRGDRGFGGGGGGPGGGGRGGPGGGGDATARRNNYLNNTSPESRAQRGEYRRMVNERRNQRGISG